MKILIHHTTVIIQPPGAGIDITPQPTAWILIKGDNRVLQPTPRQGSIQNIKMQPAGLFCRSAYKLLVSAYLAAGSRI
jgi:hypothetical protein